MKYRIILIALLSILVFFYSCSVIQDEFSDEDWSFVVFGDIRTGYGGDFHHFIKASCNDQNNRFNIKAIGILNEVVEDFDL